MRQGRILRLGNVEIEAYRGVFEYVCVKLGKWVLAAGGWREKCNDASESGYFALLVRKLMN